MFRCAGLYVIDVSQCACGFDLVVSFGPVTVMVEVKDGQKVPSARKLTKNEAEVFSSSAGLKAIVESRDDAIRLVERVRSFAFSIQGYGLNF